MFLNLPKIIFTLHDNVRNGFEICLIELVFATFEFWKSWCQKNIYNNSGLNFLYQFISLLMKLKVDQFVGDNKFYKSFIEDHLKWIKEMNAFYTKQQDGNEEEEKWKSLVMVDYKSLEAAKTHQEVIEKLLKNV